MSDRPTPPAGAYSDAEKRRAEERANVSPDNPDAKPNRVVGVYDRPERQGMSPMMIVVIVGILVVLGIIALFVWVL